MHINLEARDKHTVRAYDERELLIDSIHYKGNLIVSSHEIITPWSIETILELGEESLLPLIKYQPKVVLIGHNLQGKFPSSSVIQHLAQKGIGLECMSIGAACRTFNVLLSEQREVALGIIF